MSCLLCNQNTSTYFSSPKFRYCLSGIYSCQLLGLLFAEKRNLPVTLKEAETTNSCFSAKDRVSVVQLAPLSHQTESSEEDKSKDTNGAQGTSDSICYISLCPSFWEEAEAKVMLPISARPAD